jgi:hypothetical protein
VFLIEKWDQTDREIQSEVCLFDYTHGRGVDPSESFHSSSISGNAYFVLSRLKKAILLGVPVSEIARKVYDRDCLEWHCRCFYDLCLRNDSFVTLSRV